MKMQGRTAVTCRRYEKKAYGSRLYKGTTITCVLCGSGIKAYLVRGAVIALRNEDADKVPVSEIKN